MARDGSGGAGVPILVGAGLLGGLALGAVGVLLFGDEAAIRYTDLPVAEGEVPPPEPELAAPEPPGEPVTAAPEPPAEPPDPAPPQLAPPLRADPELLEPGPEGPLPRIAEDGRRPLETYARRQGDGADGPVVAVLVEGLGLQAEASASGLQLPPEIGLVFSPYGDDLQVWLERAREGGHEVYLALPMEPADYPASDPGPHTLRAGEVEDNARRLAWLLARGGGYVGLAGAGLAFATSEPAREPVLEDLAARGLGLIELGATHLAEAAAAAGLAYVSAEGPLDEDPVSSRIDAALEALAGEARRNGRAVGFLQPYPVSLERLAIWAERLPAEGVALVPPSSLLIEDGASLASDGG
jgi:uncharacterized protein